MLLTWRTLEKMTSLSLLESRDDPAENCDELAKWKTRTLSDLNVERLVN